MQLGHGPVYFQPVSSKVVAGGEVESPAVGRADYVVDGGAGRASALARDPSRRSCVYKQTVCASQIQISMMSQY
jgi:hypothetical protein